MLNHVKILRLFNYLITLSTKIVKELFWMLFKKNIPYAGKKAVTLLGYTMCCLCFNVPLSVKVWQHSNVLCGVCRKPWHGPPDLMLAKTEDRRRRGWWHYWLNGHEFEQTLGDSEGRESLTCCRPRGHKQPNKTELLNNNSSAAHW